jgi:hypothetical protein
MGEALDFDVIMVDGLRNIERQKNGKERERMRNLNLEMVYFTTTTDTNTR